MQKSYCKNNDYRRCRTRAREKRRERCHFKAAVFFRWNLTLCFTYFLALCHLYLRWLRSCLPLERTAGRVSPWWYGVLKEHLIREIRGKGGCVAERHFSSYDIPLFWDIFISARLLNITDGGIESFGDFFFYYFLLIGVTKWKKEIRGHKQPEKKKNTSKNA